MDRIRLYIDKENIKSIVQSRDKDLFDDCARLIRKNIDIHYNFSKNEVVKDPYMQLWFRCVMGQGVDNQYDYSESEDDILPIRPISYEDFAPDGEEDPFGIYLLEDKEACLEIKKHNCVLIGEVGKELNVLQELLRINESDEVFAKNVRWEDYCPKLPLTDILLCDNYYFKNPDIYSYNNNELIRVLSSVPNKFPVNLVIITRISDISPNIKIKDELENIKEIVCDASDNKDSSVTIIGINDDMHDRDLLTNYYRIHSTGGFQKQHRVKSDLRFEIKSHVKGRNYHNSWELIKSTYQKALRHAVFCLGDKVSNYIDFSICR